MKFSKKFLYIILFFVIFLTVSGSMFIVNQAQQTIVLQFGEPKQTHTEPGLKFKIPFINDVIYYDARVLNLDPRPEEMILSDQKRIIVDSFARYRIRDPLKFYQTVRNETTFADRFGRILNASVRGVIAKYPLNFLLSADRDSIMNTIQDIVVSNEKDYGIEIIDIRIGRTDLTEEVSNNVFQRMRSEREKEANLLRAEGSEISKAIRASADRQKTVIVAEAERQSSILRGEGDAEKNRLLGEAYGVDKDFFNFLRTMQACRDTFGDTEMSMVISPGQVCNKFFGELNINKD